MIKYSRHLSILILSISTLVGQKVSISGKVTDAVSGTPLIGANVFLSGTSLGTATNDEGQYIINGVGKGDYTVKVTYIGYTTLEDSLIIDSVDVTRNFTLNYTSIQGEEVVVMGQAKGQLDAINKQLASKSMINVVSSDRIQELPDANAAESVARVPGVTIKREGGEGNKVVIRGLSPKYNSITVDGTKLASTDSDDRSTDLSMISQYMLDGIEVTKAGTPELDGDVLGGTVNFILKKAKPGLNADIIAQGMNNSLQGTYDDNKLVIGIGNRFLKNSIGVFGQIDFENRNRSSNSIGVNYTNPGAKLDSINELSMTNFTLSNVFRKNKRENQLLVLDYVIPDAFNILSNGSISYSTLSSSIYKDVNNYIDSYVVTPSNKNHTTGTNDSQIGVKTNTLKIKQTFFNDLHIDAFMSSSQSTNDQQTYAFNFQETFAYKESTFKKSLNELLSIAKQDTANLALNDYSFNYFYSNETEKTHGINLQYDFRLTKYLSGKVKVGNKFRKKSRAFDRNYEYAPVGAAVGLQEPRDSLAKHFPRVDENKGDDPRRLSMLAFINRNYDSKNFMNGKYPSGPVADIDFMMEVYTFFRQNFHRYAPGASTIDEHIMHKLHESNSIQYDYTGTENYSAKYAMIDLDILSKLNVIYGARTELNKTTYNSWRSIVSTLPHWIYTGEEFSYDRENEFVLPALFLKYSPYDWLTLRYASTRTLTRPNYTDIIPFYEWSGMGNTVDYRTPYLTPAVSENIDYNISVNNNYVGFFSIGYFEKSISDLIFSGGRRVILDPEEYGLDPGTYYGQILNFTSNNPYPVSLKGLEFDWQTRFWYLPGMLSGLVLNANYTVTESEVQYPRTVIESTIDWSNWPPVVSKNNIDTTYVDRLIDQPDQIINFSIGYDYKGFSGRLSMLHKSNIFMATDFWRELRVNTDAYTRWDLSMKQELPVKGLSIFMNVNNITETVDINQYKYGSLSLEQHYGRTIDLGFKYSF